MEAISPPNFLKKFNKVLSSRFWLKVVSFDLFDTLVTRPVAVPSDLFQLIERDLIDRGYTLSCFAVIREKLEFQLREERSFGSEVRLCEIYEGIREYFDLSLEETEIIKNVELDVELARLSIIHTGKRMLTNAARKRRVILITDTYFPKQFIERIVSKLGLSDKISRIYCSSESGAQKSTGKLFEYVLTEENIKPRQLLHIGDNVISDIKNAKLWGVNTFLMHISDRNRYEQPLENTSSFDESRVLGVTREVRLKNDKNDLHQSTIWDVGCNVASPLIVSHVIWLLQKAKERGVSQLFFVARDGQILLRVARIMSPAICPEVKLRYLYSSRNALLFPSINNDIEAHWDWIFARTSSLSPRMVFSRLYQNIEDFEEELLDGEFERKSWDRELSLDSISCLKGQLCGPAIRNRIQERADIARDLTVSYLKQVGFLGDGKSVLVDVGWNGTLQRAISKILEASGYDGPTEGFYFGLLNRKKNKKSDLLFANFVDQVGINRFSRIDYFVPLIELFVSATHGGTDRYELVGSEIKPKFRSERNETALEWGLDVLQDSISAVAKGIVAFEDFSVLEHPLGDLGIRNFKLFSQSPTRQEAKVFGAFLDAEDQNETKFRELASPFRLNELRKLKSNRLTRHNNDWRSASLVLTPALSKRWMGLVESSLAEHPVAGDCIELLQGVGSVEGPVPELGLGKFVWVYGPRAILRIGSTPSGSSLLKMHLRNFHEMQELSIKCRGAEVHAELVPINFGALDQEDFILKVRLPSSERKLEVIVDMSRWQEEERPLGVLLTKVEISHS